MPNRGVQWDLIGEFVKIKCFTIRQPERVILRKMTQWVFQFLNCRQETYGLTDGHYKITLVCDAKLFIKIYNIQ